MGSATRTAGPASKAPLVIPCHFSFIRTISISNDARCTRTFHWTTLNSPFVYLHSLCLDNMFWTDVLDLIVWMPKLQRLTSRATRFRSPLPAQVTLTCFTSVPKLEELRLDFTQDADHQHRLTLTDTTRSSHTTGTLTSTMARRRHASGPPRLPSSLKVLEISHLADFEEHLMADDLARGSHAADNDDARAAAWRRDWSGIESTLQQKYSVFLGLEQLKELTIGRCTTYTATIWRDYLRPCTRSTEKLHLIGWPGNGMQEHPDAWQRRKETAKALDQNVDHVMLEVDRAMADTLGSMESLRHLTLTDFACTPGLVQAITQLSQNRVLVAITATVGDNAAPSLNLTLAQFRECQSKHLHRATFQWGAAEPPRQRPMTRQQKAFLQIR
ncbi:hypothetical protein BC940DRAFT_295050 [Gongronella butleri]|nr:hypothetical protein BC940DRAFT_295050 [Gongronella butleri]